MVFSLLSLAETYFVSQLGARSMAALTLCIPVYALVVSTASGTGVGVTSVISRTLGEGNIKYADNVAWHGILISIIYSVVFIWAGLKYIDSLLILFGCTPEIFALSKGYLIINLLACTFTFPAMMIANIIQGEGNTVIPMLTMLMGMTLNVLLDPIFIFGYGHLRALGLNGAALAGVLAQLLVTIMLVVLLFKRRGYLTWSIRNFRPDLKVMKDIYSVALPSTVMEILGVLVMVFLNRIVAGFGVKSLAALGIFLRIRSLAFMPIYGICQGALPVIGFAYGARKYDRVKEAIIKSLVISWLFASAAWLIIQLYPVWLINFFSTDLVLIRVGAEGMRLATFFLPVMGPIIVFYTILQAMGKGVTAMWLSLIRQLGLFLPMLIVFPRYTGLRGVWWSFSWSEIASVFLTIFFLVKLWRELQSRRKLAMLMLLRPRFFWRRLTAWLRW